MPYIKPGTYTERTGLAGTPLGNTSFFIPTVIAKTLGKETQISRTATALSDGAYVTINGTAVAIGDTLTYEQVTYNSTTKVTTALGQLPVVQVLSVSATTTDPFKREYIEGIAFTLNKTTGILDFTSAPTLLSPEFDNFSQTTGGSIASGNYQFAITALDANSNETLATNYSSTGNAYYTVDVSSSIVTVAWGAVKNAAGYKIYGQPNSGAADSTWLLLATVSSGTTTSQNITAAITAGAVTLPTTNSTQHTPQNGATVFISYSHTIYNYNAPTRYYDTNIVQTDHGIGSEAANAARLVMGPAGQGQANASMYLIAPEVSTGEIVGYQNAIAACESLQDLLLMATTSSSDTVNETLKAHCEDMSSVDNSKERFCFVSTTSAVMADTDVTLVTDKISALNGSNRCAFVVTDGGYPMLDSWQNTIDKLNLIDNQTKTDPYTLNLAVDGQWHAIATMGRLASLADPAVPGTGKQVYGISSGLEGTVRLWLPARKDTIAAAGGLVLEDRFNNLFIRHALTLSQASTEDSELSIVMAEAYMAKTLRDETDKYVGNKITNTLIQAIDDTTNQTLNSLVGSSIIRSFETPSVFQDTTKPTWVYIRFDYSPIYPSNVLKFEWGFNISG